MGSVFLAGLLITLVPLGLGLGWLGGTINLDRGLRLIGAGWPLIAVGLFTALGGGIDLARLMPGKQRPVAGSLAGTSPGAWFPEWRVSVWARCWVRSPYSWGGS
jgi:cytochrome c biogenesis protein CcdA